MNEQLDYSKLSPEIMEIIDEFRTDVTEDEAKVSFDGRMFLVRIPNDISRAMQIQKKDKFRFIVTNTLNESVLSVEYVRSE